MQGLALTLLIGLNLIEESHPMHSIVGLPTFSTIYLVYATIVFGTAKNIFLCPMCDPEVFNFSAFEFFDSLNLNSEYSEYISNIL